MILFELDRLKSSIDEALLASLRPPQGFSHSLSSDSRVARNLRNLVQAARHFHSAASSTASTVRERSGSLVGDFPAYRRERVETFIRTVPHGHVASGLGTPTATARAVSPPPDSVRAPRSPPAASPEPLRVATQSRRWSVVEDEDEDDEAEFESQFLNGLEDLAKDNIRRKYFAKAIELLTEAIQRKEKAGASKEDIRRLQTLLALCHFFCDDWKQAESIVTALAKPTGSLSYVDPMVWTMLHALALAHLSTYAFDSALKTCKRAIQAQRKWAMRQGLDRTNIKGCAETTGLLAMIFHMKGDYIAAEIYRRQEPEHFVYHHCGNPREFLSSQRDLLEGLLGDDLPDFCDCPPVNNLPLVHAPYRATHFPAQEEPPRPTQGGGDMSPLRASSYQWEKFELDTAKEAVVSTTDPPDEANDADDEAASTASSSPHNTTGIGGLRRRATRIFGTVRAGRHRASNRQEAEEYSGASSPSESPVRRWFKPGNIFALKPSKTVLRKRRNNDAATALDLDPKRPRTFRVLNVVHVTGTNSDSSEPSSPSHGPLKPSSMAFPDGGISVPAELPDTARVATPAPRTPGSEVPDNFTFRNGILYADSVPRRHGGESQPVAPEPSCSLQTSVIYTRLPELPDTSVSATNRQRAPDRANLVNILRYYSLIPRGQDATRSEMSHLALPSRNRHPQMTALEARATLLAPRKVGCILARGGPAVLPPAVVPQHNAEALPQEAALTLFRLTSIMASLPEARKSLDKDRLRETRIELEALSRRLERWSTDSLLHRDLQTVIKSLPDKDSRPDEGQDSGYESMGHESSSERDALSDGEDSGSEQQHVPKDSKPQATSKNLLKDLLARKPELKRRGSWAAGDDAAFLASPASLRAQDPIPRAGDGLVMDSGKYAEGDLGKDAPSDAILMEWVRYTREAERLESEGREST
jgi:hypothetical protein